MDLKEYTSKAKDLEVAIYTQSKLMEEHKKIIKDKKPTEPTCKQFPKPNQPVREDYVKTTPGKIEVWILLIFPIIGLGFGLLLMEFFPTFSVLLISAGFTLSGLIYYNDRQTINSQTEQRNLEEQAYQKALNDYPIMLESYNNNIKKEQERYNAEYDTYLSLKNEYERTATALATKHTQCLSQLNNALAELYSNNILFEKYRNLVAVTAINEYLLSGRCYELEGPNGAYNLYEMELRQNIIIGQLSHIITNLENIKSNQYSLYQELKIANQLVSDITYELRTLNHTTKLNAYFSAVNAKIAASPKVTYGIIY